MRDGYRVVFNKFRAVVLGYFCVEKGFEIFGHDLDGERLIGLIK
jgi:hypothetical protein